ncbi:hypothetical protein [Sphingomonas sp. Leaf23]|uniref:hypothetical protein n=1 Tax=Sphingomonas sp. Leaf23 TaxID=1735689 RepID=UPI0012E2E7E7|nr:hypothetical protein [Sphingomonas sp. Leaf23]
MPNVGVPSSLRFASSGRAMTLARIAALALVLGACRMGDAGTLVPIDGGRISGDGMSVREGRVVAVIQGQWAAEASQALQLRYTNGGIQPVRVELAPLRLRRGGEEAALWSVSDMAGVNRSDGRSDNDVPPVLYDAGSAATAPTLTVPAKGERSLAIGFANFTGKERIRAGDIVRLDLPMPGRTRHIRFRAE